MADEARVTSSLQIRKTNSAGDVLQLDYQSRPSAFTADVTGTKGPTPGALTVQRTRTDVDLSQLTTPGLCRFMNLDATSRIYVGLWNPDVPLEFTPMMMLLPGESFVFRLADNIGSELDVGTGTGTADPGRTVKLSLKAAPAVAFALIEAFEA